MSLGGLITALALLAALSMALAFMLCCRASRRLVDLTAAASGGAGEGRDRHVTKEASLTIAAPINETGAQHLVK